MRQGTSLGLFAIMSVLAAGCAAPVENTEATAELREAVVQSSFVYQKTATYQGGFQADLRFTNTTGVEMHGWEIRLDFPVPATVIAAQPGAFSHFTTRGIDNRWIFFDPDAVVPVGGSVTVTISVSTTSNTGSFPTSCTLNGVVVTCDGSNDLTPPSAPGPINLTYVGPNIIEGNFGASTDNVGVVAYRLYRIFQSAPQVEWFESSSTSFLMTQAAGQYFLRVAAVDLAGNLSTLTSTADPVITPPHPVRMTFRKTQVWPGGFNGEISLENLSPDQVSNWQATFTLPGVNSVWGATWQASPGDTEFVFAPSHNPTLSGGGGILLGINATGSAVPTACSFFAGTAGTCQLVLQ